LNIKEGIDEDYRKNPFPLDRMIVCSFLHDSLVHMKFKYSTVANSHKKGLYRLQVMKGFASPSQDSVFKNYVNGFLIALKERFVDKSEIGMKKIPLLKDLVYELISPLDKTKLSFIRDRAILLMNLICGLRSDSLEYIQLKHIKFDKFDSKNEKILFSDLRISYFIIKDKNRTMEPRWSPVSCEENHQYCPNYNMLYYLMVRDVFSKKI